MKYITLLITMISALFCVNAVDIISSETHFDGTYHTTYNLGDYNSGSIYLKIKLDDLNQDYNIFGKANAAFRAQYSSSMDTIYFQVNGEGTTNSWAGSGYNWLEYREVLLTWTPTTKRIYIDGVLAQEFTGSYSFPTAGDLFIGHNSVNTNERLKGTIEVLNITGEEIVLDNGDSNPETPEPSPELPEGKIHTIGVVTDLHNTIYSKSIAEVDASTRMDMFYDEMAQNGAILGISVGDNINERTNYDEQILQMQSFTDLWQKPIPLWSVVGNHDVNTLTQPEVTKSEMLSIWSDFFGDNDYYYKDHDGIRYMFLNSMYGSDGSFGYHNGQGGYIHQDQLTWIEETLSEAQSNGYYVIMSTHLLLDEQINGIMNRQEVLDIMANYQDTIIAVFQGDTHENNYNLINGVHYITFYSPVLHSYNPENYALIDVYADRLEVDGFGSVPDRVLSLNDLQKSNFGTIDVVEPPVEEPPVVEPPVTEEQEQIIYIYNITNVTNIYQNSEFEKMEEISSEYNITTLSDAVGHFLAGLYMMIKLF